MGRFHDGGRVHQPGQTEPIINVLVVAEVMIFPDYENNYSMFMYFVGACHFKRKKKKFDNVPITEMASKRVFNIFVLLMYKTVA